MADPVTGVAAGVDEGPGPFGTTERVVGGDGVCAHRNAPKHDRVASAESKRPPAFDVFRIASSEGGEYTDVYLNGRLTSTVFSGGEASNHIMKSVPPA
jgi:hypothetical protein